MKSNNQTLLKMNKTRIYLFIFSLGFGSISIGISQERNPSQTDSIYYKEKYGLRVGIDLSKPIRSLFDDNYTGIEIKADYRFNKRFFPAIELGHEKTSFSENLLSGKTGGSYAKIGINYNTYQNWIGMQNEIYVGFRYGFSTFSETLTDYTIYDFDHYFSPDYRNPNKKFSNLNAHWIEFQLGIKAEVLNNLYLGIHAELKRLITEKAP